MQREGKSSWNNANILSITSFGNLSIFGEYVNFEARILELEMEKAVVATVCLAATTTRLICHVSSFSAFISWQYVLEVREFQAT